MRELYRRYMGNLHDRIATTGAASFGVNALTGIGQLTLGIFLLSPWYIANAAYNVLLCIARGRGLVQFKKTRAIENDKERYDKEFAVYRRSGIFICLLGISYLGICFWMYFTGESQVQNRYFMEYAVALMAFAKITFAIHGLITNRNLHSPLISMFRTIAFLDAMVSIVVTQCTLLTMMKSLEAVSSSAFLGVGVSAVFLVLGVFTLVRKKKYPELNRENAAKENPDDFYISLRDMFPGRKDKKL